MTKPDERPTPETEVEANKPYSPHGMRKPLSLVDADFARRLERERDALREALLWYAEEAEAIARNNAKSNANALLASIHVLSMDAGKRARSLLGEAT